VNGPNIESSDCGKHLKVTCAICGKPIAVTKSYGYFCEDMCGEQEAIDADKKLDTIIDRLDGLFG